MKARMLLSGILVCSAPAIADVEDDVRCREIAFSQSIEMQDESAFRSFIDSDARFVGGSVQRGVDAVTAAWKVVFDAGNEAAEAPTEETQALLDREVDCP